LITREEAERLRHELLNVLAEDASNAERLAMRLDTITQESGVGAHAALLLILTHLPFGEDEARRHWQGILAHREQISSALGRDTGLRVAVLDYFMNINRRLVQPTLIDLEMFESMQTDAGSDPLTGLAGDRRFRAGLQTELRRARRYRQQAAVVVIDADDFFSVNERFGRLVGDRLLRELAILLNNNVRDIDVAARLGEDEMALLLPETGRNAALTVAERFRREVESYFATRECAGQPVDLTISAGVACYPEDAATAEALLSRAALALYHAKATGRNAVELDRPERRRFLRFDLDPERFEVEVLAPAEGGQGHLRNYSRTGILFSSPEPLEVGEVIEIRLLDSAAAESGGRLTLRGRVVRLEELPLLPAGETSGQPPATADRWDVGVSLEEDVGTRDVLDLLEEARRRSPGWPP
jgi:diguanylate cyclase (GGDEF)-like protein